MLAALAVAALALDSAGRSAMATAPATLGDTSVQAASQSGAYQAVAAGTYHTCAIETDGTLTCWGGAGSGQVNAPEGTFTSIHAGARYSCALGTDGAITCWGESFGGDVEAAPGGTFTSLVAGGNHACAIGADESISCWGYNAWGQLNSPEGTYVALAVGWEHSCAIATDGAVSCWGYHFGRPSPPFGGTYKALASGSVHICAIKDDDTMVCAGERNDLNRGATIAPAGTFKAVTAGRHHNCAIKMDDTITCWGVNTAGQTDAPTGTFKAVKAHNNRTCAMRMDDTITCWGSNVQEESEAPQGTFTEIGLGDLHTCAVRTDTAIVCWGTQHFGQTEEVEGHYRTIQSGRNHTCAIATDDTIACWGYNDQGQLDAPAGAFSAMSVGGEHTCALGFDGAVTCWGYNVFGQANDPAGTYKAVRAGDFHTCAIRTDDTIACWGSSTDGYTSAPAGAFKALETGYFHTCAIRNDDTVVCWGRNRDGQADAPAGAYKAISVGDAHSCAIRTDDTIACWGTNANRERRAPTGSYKTLAGGRKRTCATALDDTVTCWGPSSRAPAGTFTSLVLGHDHTCGLGSDGSVACWGGNSNGQSDPLEGTFKALSAGHRHSCGIRSDDSVTCWPRLPEGVTWSTADAMTVHDRPDVTVMFDAASHTVSEGSAVTVTLRLSANPRRTVVIPLTTTNQGGAGSDDYFGVPATVALRGVAEQAFSLTATPDSVNDAGESVLIGLGALPSGVSATAPAQTRVDIIDNTKTVNFAQPSYTVGEGGSVTVRVTLDSAASAQVDIPVSVTNQGGATSADYTTLPASVTINSGANLGTVTFTAVDDSAVESGESVRLSLGSLPPGYIAGSTNETVVNITDDDVVQVTVSFGSDAYRVDEGASRSVTVNLSADPQRTVTIPLSRTNQGGASGSDYSFPSDVTFNSGETTRTVSFSATQDSVDDDGESVRFGFTNLPAGVAAGTPNETVVSIVDDDHPAVTVSFQQNAYTIAEGDAGTIAVVLSRDPERRVEITLTVTPADASQADFAIAWPDPGNPGRLVFDAGVTEQTFTFSSLTDDEEDDAETVAISIDTPTADRVTLGPAFETTVTIGGQTRRSPGGGGSGGGGGGGGGGDGPTPSTADFEWTVKHDIEALTGGHDKPTGMWSDGATFWLLENGDGADDAVYAYDLATGERVGEREFELDGRNRAPRGLWSDGQGVVWVSDSGQEKLFAYDLATGERREDRDIELTERNADARGIWSDGETMWVLNRNPSLFAYDLTSGDFLTEYSLDPRNRDPRGIWSDGVTVWVSDHGLKDLWAYRLPVLPDEGEAAPGEPPALERIREEDFTELSGASNNSPRGVWADGDVVYVADESDGKVYTYNMPDAIDARLSSLSLSGIDIGTFDPDRTDYEGVIAEGVTETSVEAGGLQRRTEVAIDPPDADGTDTNGHQVTLAGLSEITVTVTSADGTRTRVYSVGLEAALMELEVGPSWTSFEWPGPEGAPIAEAGLPEAVVAVYTWDETTGRWLGYFPGREDVPALNTLTAFSSDTTYWVAAEEDATWTPGWADAGEQ
ncbi:MAG: cadherin-like beta sandwich domain-containing protein [Chloroflexi bacterium]|nr:cadherin-like beta sandwich domain-containing protein [Chloroflexota bacterium]